MAVTPFRSARKLHGSMFYRTQALLPVEVLHFGNKRNFRPLCSCYLYLDSMTFIYELNLYYLEIERMCENERPTSTLSKVIVWQTDRHTYIQTGPKLYTTPLPLRGWSTRMPYSMSIWVHYNRKPSLYAIFSLLSEYWKTDRSSYVGPCDSSKSNTALTPLDPADRVHGWMVEWTCRSWMWRSWT